MELWNDGLMQTWPEEGARTRSPKRRGARPQLRLHGSSVSRAHIFTELINQRWSSGAPASAAKDYVEVSQGHQYGGRRLLLITAAGPVHWPQPATVGERRAAPSSSLAGDNREKAGESLESLGLSGNLRTLIVSVRSCWQERVENPKKQTNWEQ